MIFWLSVVVAIAAFLCLGAGESKIGIVLVVITLVLQFFDDSKSGSYRDPDCLTIGRVSSC